MSLRFEEYDDNRHTGNSIVLIKEPLEETAALELLRRRLPTDVRTFEPELIQTAGGRPIVRWPVRYDRIVSSTRGLDSDGILVEPERRLYIGCPKQARQVRSAGTKHEFDWGLCTTLVDRTAYTGKEVAVAVLDTGLDRCHPDFLGRVVDADFQSFVGGTAHDNDGHGTHCAGIVCGPSSPKSGKRYGVAPDARLIVGKILEGKGDFAFDYGLLGGMVWANLRGAKVISLSLGTERKVNEPHSEIFEFVARELCSFGTIIVAATGSSNHRPSGRILPIHHPADCPTILATAAVNKKKRVANSSCGRVGSQRDPAFAAPGVSIFSAVPTTGGSRKRPYGTGTGTSAAAPLAAGIAALWTEWVAKYTGSVVAEMCNHLVKLTDGRADVGDGLVQAPL